jgi:hypothetical protein
VALVNNPRLTRQPNSEASWTAFLRELQDHLIQMLGPSSGPRIILTGSTDGRPHKVAAIASPGDTIHTCISTAGQYDELHLWATNATALPKTLTLQWGGTTAVDDEFVSAIALAANTTTLVADGLILRNGLIVKAYASVTNSVLITGFAVRLVSTG